MQPSWTETREATTLVRVSYGQLLVLYGALKGYAGAGFHQDESLQRELLDAVERLERRLGIEPRARLGDDQNAPSPR